MDTETRKGIKLDKNKINEMRAKMEQRNRERHKRRHELDSKRREMRKRAPFGDNSNTPDILEKFKREVPDSPRERPNRHIPNGVDIPDLDIPQRDLPDFQFPDTNIPNMQHRPKRPQRPDRPYRTDTSELLNRRRRDRRRFDPDNKYPNNLNDIKLGMFLSFAQY